MDNLPKGTQLVRQANALVRAAFIDEKSVWDIRGSEAMERIDYICEPQTHGYATQLLLGHFAGISFSAGLQKSA
jgi:hypothetical protein